MASKLSARGNRAEGVVLLNRALGGGKGLQKSPLTIADAWLASIAKQGVTGSQVGAWQGQTRSQKWFLIVEVEIPNEIAVRASVYIQATMECAALTRQLRLVI